MRTLYKIFTLSIIAILSSCLLSCERKDDIEEIFTNKTWYMNGKVFNGLKANSEIKTFYEYGSNAYFIHFSQESFNCVLSPNVQLSGTWQADGKAQTIHLSFNEKPMNLQPFDAQIFEIISSAKEYRSGADFMDIIKDRNNKMLFGAKR